MSRFTFCNCPAGFNADPERHAPDCPGRSGAGKARTPVPATIKPAEQHHGEPFYRYDLEAPCGGKVPGQIDERDAFEAWYADWFNSTYKPTIPLTAESMKASRKGDNYGSGSLGKNGKWSGWQARAALERKP